jgi:hypothetical protein
VPGARVMVAVPVYVVPAVTEPDVESDVKVKGTAVPDRPTVCGSGDEALSAIESVADSAPPPATLGAKTTLTMQLAPAASVVVQVVPVGVTEKSAAFVLAPGVIVGVIPVITLVVLVFLRVTDCAVPGIAVSGDESN